MAFDVVRAQPPSTVMKNGGGGTGDRELRARYELHWSDESVSLPRQRLYETRRARNVTETLA